MSMVINLMGHPIKFCGHPYIDGQIREAFSGQIVCDLTRPSGGGYFTSIPISSPEWRRRSPTQAAFRVESEGSILVMDDWGAGHRFEGSRGFLMQLFELCKKLEIPEVA